MRGRTCGISSSLGRLHAANSRAAKKTLVQLFWPLNSNSIFLLPLGTLPMPLLKLVLDRNSLASAVLMPVVAASPELANGSKPNALVGVSLCDAEPEVVAL